MAKKIIVNKSLKKPIYQQIIDGVIEKINDGIFVSNSQLPSINTIANDNQMARETVVKAFRSLQEKGIIEAIHGKGFFIASNKTKAVHRIFLLFDALSAYKEILFEAIRDEFGEEATVDIYFHHFNPKIFKHLVTEAAGNYTSYIVLPFDYCDITELLEPIPGEKLFLLDRWPKYYKNKFIGVYQDFYSDIFNALEPYRANLDKYKKLILIFRDSLTEVPLELREGFEEFCYQNKIEYQVEKRALLPNEIQKNVGYLSIDDGDLVSLVEAANANNWQIGSDIGILSYNDTPLKKVVAKGISVISTDFKAMGEKVAKQIINNKKECIANAGAFINRRSF